MKIRIIGACGSGKTTLAREISKKFGISNYEIDNLIWDRTTENKKYSEMTRDSKLRYYLGS